MSKILGYGYKLNSEDITEALRLYDGRFNKTKQETLNEIFRDKKIGNIPPNSKPKIFKIVLEDT